MKPGYMIMFLAVVLSALVMIIYGKQGEYHNEESIRDKESRLSTVAANAKANSRLQSVAPYDGWELKVLVGGMYVFVFIANAAMSMSVNMFYVSELNRHKEESGHTVIKDGIVSSWLDGRMEIVLLQIGLGLYNVVWNRYVSVLAMRFLKRMSLSEEGEGDKGRVGRGQISWQYEYGLMLLLVNSVLGPWLWTMLEDESCGRGLVQTLVHLLVSLQHDVWDLNYPRSCVAIDYRSTGSFCFRRSESIIPFLYNFTCSDKFLSSYLPIWIYHYAFSFPGSIFYYLCVTMLPLNRRSMLKSLLLVDYIYLPEEKMFARKRGKNRSSTSTLRLLISRDEISRLLACDMAIILCYGLHDPLRVGLIVAVGMLMDALKWKWLLYRYCGPIELEQNRNQVTDPGKKMIEYRGLKGDEDDEPNKKDLEDGIELRPILARTGQSPATRRKSLSKEHIEVEVAEARQNLDDESLGNYDLLNEALGSRGEEPLYRWSVQVVLVGLFVNGLVVFDMIGEVAGGYIALKHTTFIAAMSIVIFVSMIALQSLNKRCTHMTYVSAVVSND